jgi:2-dehydro-3-deoxygluconokinase
MSLLFGGAESNVAIGLARMGVHVGWCGRLGRDPIGRMIFKRIRGEGVDVSRAELTAEAPTGLMIREVISSRSSVYYYRRNSAASAMLPEHLDEAYISGARVLHVTGITPALGESCKETVREAIRIAKRAGVKVCFDPNLRLKLWSIDEARKVLLDLVKEADYFLPGWDELVTLYETENYEEIIGRLGQLSAVSIVKGKGETTLVVEKGRVTEVPFYKVDKIVDPVGAGDAFCAGFISGVVEGLSHIEAARLGNLLGSLVIQYEGDWEGIPTRDEVDAILNQVKHVER